MRIKKMKMTVPVYEEIRATIGRYPAETGGALGSGDGRTIDSFYFDDSAQTTGSTYSPNTEVLNQVIADWNRRGIRLVGFIHSHPGTHHTPSNGDLVYAERIITAMDVHGRLFMPIVNVNTPAGGKIAVYPYIVEQRRHRLRVRSIPLKLEKRPEIIPEATRNHDEPERGRFDRIEAFYPLAALKRKTVVCVGCGGTRQFVEELARSGVGNFVLIDGDAVSITNIATQQVYASEIGRNKAHALADRIREINPAANALIVPYFLDDDMPDEAFEGLIGDVLVKRPEDVLICGCTDSFHAQARSAALALKYGAPYLAGQLYKGGMAAEIYFSYPGVTNRSCPRCAMSSRYEAYANGYKNDVTSSGTPIFATTRVNATKGQIALMLLLYHEDETCVYNEMLDQIADRNFVMIQMSPMARQALGITVFDAAVSSGSGLTFFDNTVFIPQAPNDGSDGHAVCPLCGGSGDLLALKGRIQDTRRDWEGVKRI